MVLLLITSGLFLSVPWLIRAAIAALERGEPTGAFWAAGLVGAAAIVGALVRTGSRVAILGGGRFIERDVRRRLFAHLVRMPPSFYARSRVGDLMSRSTNDLMLVRAVMGPGIMYSANAVFVYAIAFAGMSQLDLQLALVMFAPMPLLTLAVYVIANRIKLTTMQAQEALGLLSSGVQETLAGIGVVHAFGLQGREARLFRERSQTYLQLNVREAKWRGFIGPLVTLAAGAATIGVIVLGGQAVQRGELEIADLAAFVATLGMLVPPTVTLGWVISLGQRGRAAWLRIGEVLAEEPSIRDRDDVLRDLTSVSGHIEVRGLSVRYAGSARRRAALEDVSFEIRPGMALGIAGATASGKTTLLRALCRLIEVEDGQILADGHELNRIPLGLWRGAVGYVPQDGFLFSATLAQNVRFGRPEATDDEVRDAVAAAALDVDLDALPHGLDTLVGPRGVQLSGGQRQRLALARALLLRPKVLLLDDSLSNVDTATAARILARLREHAGRHGAAIVLAAHRTATLSFCDEVVVLDAGRCVERGTPAELALQDQGVFAALAAREREDAAFARLGAESDDDGAAAAEPAAARGDGAEGGAR